jgi:hypothetical protein
MKARIQAFCERFPDVQEMVNLPTQLSWVDENGPAAAWSFVEQLFPTQVEEFMKDFTAGGQPPTASGASAKVGAVGDVADHKFMKSLYCHPRVLPIMVNQICTELMLLVDLVPVKRSVPFIV